MTASFDAFLAWWIAQGRARAAAKDADAMFRSLVTPALSAALD